MSDAWPSVPLDEVCDRITDGTHHSPVNSPTGSFRYVTAKNIRPWGLDLSDISYVDEDTHYAIYARCPVEQGDVLYIKDGATTGLAVVNPLSEQFSMLSSVALLKPKRDLLEPMYLKHWLNSPRTVAQMTSAMTGTAIKRLVLRQIRAARIPLPSIRQQRLIVSKLNVLFSTIQASRDHLDRVPPILKKFGKAVLEAAVSGRLTEIWRTERTGSSECKGWTDGTMGTTGAVTGGLTKNASRIGMKLEKPYLRVANVYSNRLDLAEISSIGLTESEWIKTALRPDDLLIVEGNGSLDQIGRVARWSGELPECSHQNHLIRWRSNGNVSSKYALYWLMSPAGRDSLMSLANTSAGLYTLSISKVSGVRIRVPPLSEQMEIVSRVDELLGLADSLLNKYRGAVFQTEQVIPALLTKAFRGELVAQDPNDEPAVEMLMRLASSANPPGARNKKRAAV